MLFILLSPSINIIKTTMDMDDCTMDINSLSIPFLRKIISNGATNIIRNADTASIIIHITVINPNRPASFIV